jgi:hypothetical protein
MSVIITALRSGFRRAGISHYGTVVYPDDFFNPDDLERLTAEPNLKVTFQGWADDENRPLEPNPETAADLSPSAAVSEPLEPNPETAADLSPSAAVPEPLESNPGTDADLSPSAAVSEPKKKAKK